MATVYSYTNDDGFRCKCEYSTSTGNTSVTVSGTIYLQHKGSAWSSPYYSYSGGLEKYASIFNESVAETASVSSVSKHTDWTTIKSKSFSTSVARDTSTYNKTFYVGLYSFGVLGEYKSFTVSIPALTSYSVTYNANGGSGAPSTQKKYYGKTLTLSSTKPTRSGYVFYHWNTNTSNTGTTYNAGASYSSNSALSLYAIWNPYIYYNANGGTGAPSTQTKTYGTNLTLSSTTPTRTGYKFNGWNTKADGSGTSYSAGATYSSNTSVTLYAQWQSYPKKPTIANMKAVRWDFTENVQDDTSTDVKVSLNWSVDLTSSVYGNNNSGTVTLTATPQSGSTQPTVTAVSGTTGVSGTAVFTVSNADTDMQYYITATVTDVYSSTSNTIILTRAFFIMDFKAGGEGIGIGRSAPNTGLEVGYDATFDNDVTVLGDESVVGKASVTGNISTDGTLIANATNIDLDTTPSANISANKITYLDADGESIGRIYARQTASNEAGLQFGGVRVVNGSTVYNLLSALISPTGERSWQVSDPSSFRAGIGVDNLWHVTTPTATGYSFSANQYRSLSITLGTTYSGFTAIPVRAVCTSHSAIRVFNYSISNNTTFNFETLSQSSSSLSGVNFAFTVLWLNNNFF